MEEGLRAPADGHSPGAALTEPWACTTLGGAQVAVPGCKRRAGEKAAVVRQWKERRQPAGWLICPKMSRAKVRGLGSGCGLLGGWL